MRVAIDKNSINVIKDYNYEFVYLFNNESYEDLKKLGIHCLYYELCDFVDINLTEYDIDCLKKANKNDKDWNKIPDKIDYKLGIIIPNCNYGELLPTCFDSILKQTYKNYEVIFVDDVSTDNSLDVAKEYSKKFLSTCKDFKIISLKQKRYNGGARNEAYLHLSNDVDYIYYIDSDDWLYDDKAFEEINKRLQGKPDVCFVGMMQYKKYKYSIAHIPKYKDKYEAFSGWSGSCGKVIKKQLAVRQECLYNEGTLKEDKNQHCKICFYMNSFTLLKKPIYVWNRQNTKSVTTVRENIIWGTSTIRHYADTKQLLLTIKGQDKKIDELMKQRLVRCKTELLNGGDRQF